MSVAPEFGNGATLVFGSSGWTAKITKISKGGIAREFVDVSHLGTTPAGAGKFGGKIKKPAKLIDAGQLVVEYQMDGDQRPLVMEDPETATLTFPLSDGESTPTIWEGEAFATNVDGPDFVNDEVQAGTMALECSGEWEITPAA
jgi:hypothetical protein